MIFLWHKRHFCLSKGAAFLALFLLTCAPKSTNYPEVSMPEGADPESPYWKGIDLEPKPPVVPVPVEDQLKKFLLPPGYKMEAVLTEPEIQQPGAITFDGNGRMYVLELRSYMLTVDSEGTLEPVSGISRWEDLDNDGVYESGKMFVDSLVFPRFVLPYGPNSILTMESNADDVFKYTDTDHDGVADKKEFFTNNFGRSGNVEHQQAFLYWGMDNWLYSTVNPFRVRETAKGVIRESTGSNHAQWGITHDDDGKLWFQGGSNGLPAYFQFPIHYGDYVVENNFAEGFEVPWGAPVHIADMQGGMGAVRQPDGSLNRVTGAAGNDIFRGHRLPKELYGQYFYGEPVARIVRQINAVDNEGILKLHNVYQEEKSEFIRSSDPLFRPVDMATAPDGTMYIVDMYHGIIQEGQWTPVGSYLRLKIEQYQLDKVVGLGRIWRLTHESEERDKTQPRMYDESSEELLAHFNHPNGWWRDLAQQILVQRGDKSVAPALEKIALSSNNILARFHALWTLEGIGSLSADLVHKILDDENPRMIIQGMWVSESLYKAGDKSFEKDYLSLMGDQNREVAMRAMMTGRLLKIPGTNEKVKEIMAMNKEAGIQLVGRQVLEPPHVTAFFGRSDPNFSDEQKKLVENGLKIYDQLCATCHGVRGTGTLVGDNRLMAPSLVSSAKLQGHRDYAIKAVMKGLMGDIDGVSYTGGVMVPMGNQTDEWIASVVSFIRANFENESKPVTVEDVARVRKQTEGQQSPYKYQDLLASVPTVLAPSSDWIITASNTGATRKGSTESPLGAFSFEGWTTGVTQQEGMWYQIEFPKATDVTEFQFNSPPISRGWREGSPPPIQTFPSNYDVKISMDGENWQTIIEGEEGKEADMIIQFDRVSTKFIRITLNESLEVIHGQRRGQPFDYEVVWNMKEMKVYGFK